MQAGVFGEASGERDKPQESSGHPDFPVAGKSASDPTERVTVSACHAQGFLTTAQGMLSVADAGF